MTLAVTKTCERQWNWMSLSFETLCDLVSPFSPTQTIMKDKWMNIGYEDDELKPFVEPLPDINDPVRIGNVQHLHLLAWRATTSFFSLLFFGWLAYVLVCPPYLRRERTMHAACPVQSTFDIGWHHNWPWALLLTPHPSLCPPLPTLSHPESCHVALSFLPGIEWTLEPPFSFPLPMTLPTALRLKCFTLGLLPRHYHCIKCEHFYKAGHSDCKWTFKKLEICQGKFGN